MTEPTTEGRASDGAALPPEVQIARCPAGGHDGEHFQGRTHDHWLCGHLLVGVLAAQGIRADDHELRARVAAIAKNLEESAAATHPSRKSEIQRDTAQRIREALAG